MRLFILFILITTNSYCKSLNDLLREFLYSEKQSLEIGLIKKGDSIENNNFDFVRQLYVVPKSVDIYNYLYREYDFVSIEDSIESSFKFNFKDSFFDFGYSMKYSVDTNFISISLLKTKDLQYAPFEGGRFKDFAIDELKHNLWGKIMFHDEIVLEPELNAIRNSLPNKFKAINYLRCESDEIEDCTSMLIKGETCSTCYTEHSISTTDFNEFLNDFITNQSLSLNRSACFFIPHDGIVIYDNSNSPLYSIDICYNCGEVNFYSYVTNESRMYGFDEVPNPKSKLLKELQNNNSKNCCTWEKREVELLHFKLKRKQFLLKETCVK